MATGPIFFFFFQNSAGLLVAVTEADINFFTGDSVCFFFTVQNGDDPPEPVNLSTLGIAFTIQRDLQSAAVITKTVGDGITVVGDGSSGQFKLILTAAETAALMAFYIYSIRLTTLDDQVATSQIGRLSVRQSPLWTYSGDPRLCAKDSVRFLIGDTVYKDQQFTDPEILHAINLRSSSYGAAAVLCRSLAAKFAREADTVDRDLRTTLSARSRAYRQAAIEYDNQALLTGAGAMPYAGGISQSDKLLQELNPDRVTPQFNIGMDDNEIPVSQSGNETPPI